MSFLNSLYAERQKLAQVLADPEYSGIREIVEELYPDRAHFIYELLQNAEDVGATEASFTLNKDKVSFEHNGDPFSERNVRDITNIGKGTKREEDDKIGRFGVGFKAVFAYTETPHIWSPTFSFKISELVLPTALDRRRGLRKKTRFEFPFNNPKKTADDAYDEVEAGLTELADTTLLFLAHIESICWQIGETPSGVIKRVPHSEHHFEILKKSTGATTASSHFLRFDRPVEGLGNHRVAVAFELDYLPNVRAFDPSQPLKSQMKIVPAAPGRVAVYFPAAKEASGLRFHLHGPFVPELSRASVKETPANQPLFQQLATLSAASLHQIRDLGLLTAEFLGVLPNSQDEVFARYQGIRTAIIEEMKNQPLTPTLAKTHAAAKDLRQARASIKKLLSDDDIEFLIDYQDNRPQWAIAATQKNSNADRFLTALEIAEWGIPQFAQVLRNKTTVGCAGPPIYITAEQFMRWLGSKPLEWHQELYALLNSEYPPSGETLATSLGSCRIVRLDDGNYGVGGECFFPNDGPKDEDDVFPRVDARVYTSGRSQVEQEHSKEFLDRIGVREVREADQVEAILKRRYSFANFKPNRQDLKRFIALVENEPRKARLFAEYAIFERKDGKYGTPSEVFLDLPFLDTGLSAYYDGPGKAENLCALADSYQNSGIPAEKLVKFAGVLFVKTELQVRPSPCSLNPRWVSLQRGDKIKFNNDKYGRIDKDFIVPEFDQLVAFRTEAASRLIWLTMIRVVKDWNLGAHWRRNNHSEPGFGPSRLVLLLQTAEWVPQSNGRFVRPEEASADLLPAGFPFDHEWDWLRMIEFRTATLKRNEELQQWAQAKESAEQQRRQREAQAKQLEEQGRKELVARELGFSDNASLERARRFGALPAEVQNRILADCERGEAVELPERESHNSARRSRRVAAQAAEAPGRHTEQRTRSVAVGREAVKEEAKHYLRHMYTKADGEMICQVCKAPLPFRLADGTYYFEAVEFLPELERRHHQNYLALCPNHAAMFQYANDSADRLRELFAGLLGNELTIILARKDAPIYFTKLHRDDLKAVIEEDRKQSRGDGDTA